MLLSSYRLVIIISSLLIQCSLADESLSTHKTSSGRSAYLDAESQSIQASNIELSNDSFSKSESTFSASNTEISENSSSFVSEGDNVSAQESSFNSLSNNVSGSGTNLSISDGEISQTESSFSTSSSMVTDTDSSFVSSPNGSASSTSKSFVASTKSSSSSSTSSTTGQFPEFDDSGITQGNSAGDLFQPPNSFSQTRSLDSSSPFSGSPSFNPSGLRPPSGFSKFPTKNPFSRSGGPKSNYLPVGSFNSKSSQRDATSLGPNSTGPEDLFKSINISGSNEFMIDKPSLPNSLLGGPFDNNPTLLNSPSPLGDFPVNKLSPSPLDTLPHSPLNSNQILSDSTNPFTDEFSTDSPLQSNPLPSSPSSSLPLEEVISEQNSDSPSSLDISPMNLDTNLISNSSPDQPPNFLKSPTNSSPLSPDSFDNQFSDSSSPYVETPTGTFSDFPSFSPDTPFPQQTLEDRYDESPDSDCETINLPIESSSPLSPYESLITSSNNFPESSSSVDSQLLDSTSPTDIYPSSDLLSNSLYGGDTPFTQSSPLESSQSQSLLPNDIHPDSSFSSFPSQEPNNSPPSSNFDILNIQDGFEDQTPYPNSPDVPYNSILSQSSINNELPDDFSIDGNESVPVNGVVDSLDTDQNGFISPEEILGSSNQSPMLSLHTSPDYSQAETLDDYLHPSNPRNDALKNIPGYENHLKSNSPYVGPKKPFLPKPNPSFADFDELNYPGANFPKYNFSPHPNFFPPKKVPLPFHPYSSVTPIPRPLFNEFGNPKFQSSSPTSLPFSNLPHHRNPNIPPSFMDLSYGSLPTQPTWKPSPYDFPDLMKPHSYRRKLSGSPYRQPLPPSLYAFPDSQPSLQPYRVSPFRSKISSATFEPDQEQLEYPLGNSPSASSFNRLPNSLSANLPNQPLGSSSHPAIALPSDSSPLLNPIQGPQRLLGQDFSEIPQLPFRSQPDQQQFDYPFGSSPSALSGPPAFDQLPNLLNPNLPNQPLGSSPHPAITSSSLRPAQLPVGQDSSRISSQLPRRPPYSPKNWNRLSSSYSPGSSSFHPLQSSPLLNSANSNPISSQLSPPDVNQLDTTIPIASNDLNFSSNSPLLQSPPPINYSLLDSTTPNPFSNDFLQASNPNIPPNVISSSTPDVFDDIFNSLKRRYEITNSDYLISNSVYPQDISSILDTMTDDELTYNIVIVGSSPAALSALKTLSDLGKRILLVERGGLPPQISESLYYRPKMLQSNHVRAIKSSAPHCDVEKIIYVPNVLGEESTYDSNIWDYGVRSKYIKWGKLCNKWTWNNVLSYFPDENNQLTCPIPTSRNIEDTKAINVVTKIFSDAGLSRTEYVKGKRPDGLTAVPSLRENGENVILSRKIFENLAGYSNIQLALETVVDNITFDNTGKAIGINVRTSMGTIKTISILDELIIGSNPIDTVQLLYQSGIGDFEKLQDLNIPAQINLPYVGKQFLVTPLYFGVVYQFPQGTLLSDWESDLAGKEYLFGNYEMPSALAPDYFKAFLNIYESREANVILNFRVFSKSMSERLNSYIERLKYIDEEMKNYLTNLCQDHDLLWVVPQLTNVQSRGEIFIKRSDYTGEFEPIIDTGMYKSKRDITIMQKAIKVLKSIAETETFRSLNGKVVQIPVKQCVKRWGEPDFSTEYTGCSIRYLSLPNLHYSGGTIMGVSPLTSVVDEDLILRGSQNVRIFSSSVVPYGTSTDSSAVSSLVGTYGAKILAQNYQS